MGTLWRGIRWAFAGSLLSAIIWSLLAATIWRLIPPYGPPVSAREFLVGILPAFLGSGYFALFIAACAFPCYAIAFTAWLLFVRRRPWFVQTRFRRAFAALLFALPTALGLAYGFAASPGQPFDYGEGCKILLLALASVWSGIALTVSRQSRGPDHAP